MILHQQQLLAELRQITIANKDFALQLTYLPVSELTYKSSTNSWNILECIQHLNLYAEFYHKNISLAIEKSNPIAKPNYKSGWLGEYFINIIRTKDKVKKMKTQKPMNPTGTKLSPQVLKDFIKYQEELLDMIKASENINMEEIRIPTSLSSLIQLKLGDTLRFIVYHNERHIVQAKKLLA